MKSLKKLFWLTVFAVFVGLAIKYIRLVRLSIRLCKTLPLFLKNTIGDEPIPNCTITGRSLRLRLEFDEETLTREQDIEQTVREYIDDFYPGLNALTICIELKAKGEAPSQECACCQG
jgi:hypothetical protein